MPRASNSLNQPQDGRLVALRFGPFELDVRSGELRRNGTTVRLQPQPLKVLVLLTGRAGEVVTREEIQAEVWPAGTFVDFEQSLNFCVRQIRTALRDDANAPRYVETLPRRGYRWVGGPVQSEAQPAVVREWPRPLAAEAEARAPAPTPVGEGASRRPRRLVPALAGLGIVAALALVALGLLSWRRPAPGPAPEPPQFQRITFRRGAVSSARFGPSGEIVYSAAWDGGVRTLYVARSAPGDATALDIRSAFVAGVSPAGEVAFLRDGVLSRAPLAGGPPKEVLKEVMAADWDAGGREFAVARAKADRFTVEYPEGRVLTESVRPGRLRISPDGRHLALAEHPVPNDDRGLVVILDRAGRRVAATPEWASLEGLAWSPQGDEVLFTAAQAGADSSLRGLSLAGRVRTVHASTGRLVLHDVAPDGRLLLERATLRSEVLFRRAGEAEDRDLSWLDFSAVAGISPTGDTLLFYESGEGGGPEYTTFLRRTDGGAPVRVGTGRALDLSPDGRLVASVDIRRPVALDLTPTGAGETRSIRVAGVAAHEDAGFTPDGRHLFVTGRDASGSRATWLTDLEGRQPRRLPLPDSRYQRAHTFSADGERFVAACAEGPQVCSWEVASGRSQPLPGTQKGWNPVAVDTRGRVFFRAREPGQPERLLRLDPATGRATTLAELAPRDRAGAFGVLGVSVAASGEAWAYTFLRRLSDLHIVTGVR